MPKYARMPHPGGRVEESWRRRKSRLHRWLSPPLPLCQNPREREIEPKYPLGKWNLYIGGAGNQVPGYVNVDLFPLAGVDVVCTAEQLPFKENLFTRVECDAVLEHVERPERVVIEIERCLARGGIAHFVVPFCHPFHEYPYDFRRYTPDGLQRLCSRFEILENGWRTGPTATWLVFTLEYAKSWVSSAWARRIVHFVLGWILFPMRYLDHFQFTRKEAARIGNHHYLYVRKK